MQHFNIMSLHL